MAARGTATYTWSGTSGGGTTVAGTGSLHFLPSGNPGRSFDADVTLTSPETGRMRAVLLPTATFLALPPAKGLPRNKPWLKVSEATRSTLGRQLQPMGEQLRASIDPAQNVGLLLAAGQVTEVGHGTVEGVPATEHRAVVDLRQAVQLADDPGVRAQYRAMLAAGVRTLEYELWVDDSRCRCGARRRPADHRRLLDDRRVPALGRPAADRRADGQAGLRRRLPQERAADRTQNIDNPTTPQTATTSSVPAQRTQKSQ